VHDAPVSPRSQTSSIEVVMTRSENERLAGNAGTRRGANEKPAIELVVGDLVDEAVDAIIAPVGDNVGGSSRVQLALRRAAGSTLVEEYDRNVALLPGAILAPYGVIVTRGHDLRCRHVVHCRPLETLFAGEATDSSLARCLDAAFDACARLGARSVALPAIGTGSYGYRVSTVARVALKSALDAQARVDGPLRVRFVLAGPATLETFLHALSAVSPLAARE
jgi:O-acetyl-ADP-ribose deacetylase (regulator of RNase III)